jgi:hypothetical protein
MLRLLYGEQQSRAHMAIILAGHLFDHPEYMFNVRDPGGVLFKAILPGKEARVDVRLGLIFQNRL